MLKLPSIGLREPFHPGWRSRRARRRRDFGFQRRCDPASMTTKSGSMVSADCLGFDGDDHAKRMRELITACADLKFEAVRNRVLRDAEIEAAQAGRKIQVVGEARVGRRHCP